MDLQTAIEILEYHQKWRLGEIEHMIHEPKRITEALDVVLNEVKNRLGAVSSMLPDEVPNLFITLAQQIHYESVINGLDMTNIIECFNELQEAYKNMIL